MWSISTADKDDSQSIDSELSLKSQNATGRQKPTSGAARAANVFRWSSSFEFLVMSIGAHSTFLNFSLFTSDQTSNSENLIQILIIYIILGIPVSYMQVVLGQYTHVGLFFLNRMVPLGTGISYVCCLTVFATSVFQILVMETYLLYFILCFEPSGLQWTQCPPKFKNSCWEVGMTCGREPCIKEGIQLAAYIYWNQTFMNKVPPIQLSSIGTPEVSRLWGSFLSWVLIYLVSIVEFIRFRKVINCVVIITIILKIVLVISLLSNVNDLASSLRSTFSFNFNSILSLEAWKHSIQDVVRSLTLGDFTFIMFGVFNSSSVKAGSLMCFNGILSYILRLIEVLLISSATFYLAGKAGLSKDKQYLLFRPETAELGVGVIPAALGSMVAARIWTSLYFFIRCATLIVRVDITLLLMQKALYQRFPLLTSYYKYIAPILCAFGFGIGTILESKEAYHIYKDTLFLIETFVDHINVLILTILVFYIYGISRFTDDVYFMHDVAPTKFWMGTWLLSPVLLGISVDNTYIDRKHPLFIKRIIIISLMFSPYIIMCTIEILKKIFKKDIVGLFRPDPSWGPIDPQKREQRAIFNPRQHTRYTKKVYPCQHKCLIDNKVLARIIQDEDSITHPFDFS